MSGDKGEVQYPECEKLAKASEESRSIGYFLEWLLHTKGYEVCEFKESYEDTVLDDDAERGDDRTITVKLATTRDYPNDILEEEGAYLRVGTKIEDFLAEYFDIDMKKVEDERSAMLEACAPK